MTLSVVLLIGLFTLLLLLNVPVAVSIALATLAAMVVSIDAGPAFTTMAQRMVGGLDSFSLLAIPFFILSGQIMGSGGIARTGRGVGLREGEGKKAAQTQGQHATDNPFAEIEGALGRGTSWLYRVRHLLSSSCRIGSLGASRRVRLCAARQR